MERRGMEVGQLETVSLSDWDLNPCDWDLNPAKTWFQDLMKFRFLMSHHRKNPVRDKVIGKKWIYSWRNTPHRQECEPLQRASTTAWKSGVVSFYGLGNFIDY